MPHERMFPLHLTGNIHSAQTHVKKFYLKLGEIPSGGPFRWIFPSWHWPLVNSVTLLPLQKWIQSTEPTLWRAAPSADVREGNSSETNAKLKFELSSKDFFMKWTQFFFIETCRVFVSFGTIQGKATLCQSWANLLRFGSIGRRLKNWVFWMTQFNLKDWYPIGHTFEVALMKMLTHIISMIF